MSKVESILVTGPRSAGILRDPSSPQHFAIPETVMAQFTESTLRLMTLPNDLGTSGARSPQHFTRPEVRTAQASPYDVPTVETVPRALGIFVTPNSLLPQHLTKLDDVTAQEFSSPAEICFIKPSDAGTEVCPLSFRPQHEALPSAFAAQE
jgi:hypothetical protein